MAHQLLTGRLPFDDRRNPHNPVLTSVLRSILTDQLNFSRSYWEDISPEGRDFVAQALNRDPAKRPSARELLKHPWLEGARLSLCRCFILGVRWMCHWRSMCASLI